MNAADSAVRRRRGPFALWIALSERSATISCLRLCTHLTGLRHIPGRALLALLSSLLYLPVTFAAEPRVLVLNEANAPPFSNPERTGFFDVVAIEAFRRAGLELRFVTVPAERALQLSNAGVSDGELNRLASVATQYPNLIRVPEKLGDWIFAAFSKDASIPGNLGAFRGRSVGFIRGWKIYEQTMAGHKDLVAAHDAEHLFRMLQLERIDVALCELQMGLAYIQAHAINGVRNIEPPISTREVFIFLHNSHAAHVPALASALRAMKQDGTYQRAYRAKLLPYVGQSPR